MAGAVLWSRRHREDRPYGPRWFNELVRPGITRRRLNAVLAPRPGERLLEVGPGYGYYSVGVARSLQPTGTLQLLDVRAGLLDQTMARIAEAGLANAQATVGDAVRLPYPDAAFDGAFLVACLGEIADREETIRDLARVLRPGDAWSSARRLPIRTASPRPARGDDPTIRARGGRGDRSPQLSRPVREAASDLARPPRVTCPDRRRH